MICLLEDEIQEQQQQTADGQAGTIVLKKGRQFVSMVSSHDDGGPLTVDSSLKIENKCTCAIQGKHTGFANCVNLGLLPVKDPSMICPANVIARPNLMFRTRLQMGHPPKSDSPTHFLASTGMTAWTTKNRTGLLNLPEQAFHFVNTARDSKCLLLIKRVV